MGLEDAGYEGWAGCELAQDRLQWWPFVDITNFKVS
jgi:hypothetical protein